MQPAHKEIPLGAETQELEPWEEHLASARFSAAGTCVRIVVAYNYEHIVFHPNHLLQAVA